MPRSDSVAGHGYGGATLKREGTRRRENTVRILRIDEVAERIGLSRSTIWRLERRQEFPPRRRLGPNAVGWFDNEIEEWIRSRAPVQAQSPQDDRNADRSPRAAHGPP